MIRRDIVILSSRWNTQNDELAFVIRAIAGAASRWARVSVLVAGSTPGGADGAFDLMPMATLATAVWRERAAECTLIVDELTPEVTGILSNVRSGSVFYADPGSVRCDPTWHQLPFTEDAAPFVKVSIPLNPLARTHRHNGFGFVGYQLVLAGRDRPTDSPPAAASWLTAAFHDQHVIVVENGVASAWQGRALRGHAHVESRMDLLRLIAHASVCIDLEPGPLIARECVEAMRLGTPIMVPEISGPATVHSAAGRGFVFKDPEELIGAVASLGSEPIRSATSTRAQDYADANYSNPTEFSESLRAVLSHRLPDVASGHPPVRRPSDWF